MSDISKIKVNGSDYTIKDASALHGAATSSVYGGIKIGYSESGKYYAVQLNANGQAYVYVPWQAGGSSTDEKVKSAATTNATDYPILLNNGTSATTNTVLFRSGVTVNGSTGQLNAPKFNAGSLRSLKDNIRKADFSALDIINKTEIVTFTRKADETKEPAIGFIADDTDAWLSTSRHDSMDTYNCIGMLLKAVQELSARVEELEKRA